MQGIYTVETICFATQSDSEKVEGETDGSGEQMEKSYQTFCYISKTAHRIFVKLCQIVYSKERNRSSTKK